MASDKHPELQDSPLALGCFPGMEAYTFLYPARLPGDPAVPPASPQADGKHCATLPGWLGAGGNKEQSVLQPERSCLIPPDEAGGLSP